MAKRANRSRATPVPSARSRPTGAASHRPFDFVVTCSRHHTLTEAPSHGLKRVGISSRAENIRVERMPPSRRGWLRSFYGHVPSNEHLPYVGTLKWFIAVSVTPSCVGSSSGVTVTQDAAAIPAAAIAARPDGFGERLLLAGAPASSSSGVGPNLAWLGPAPLSSLASSKPRFAPRPLERRSAQKIAAARARANASDSP